MKPVEYVLELESEVVGGRLSLFGESEALVSYFLLVQI